jgi:hypothetical protein
MSFIPYKTPATIWLVLTTGRRDFCHEFWSKSCGKLDILCKLVPVEVVAKVMKVKPPYKHDKTSSF